MSDAAVHPSQQELAAFGLGKLGPGQSEAVASHLTTCDACRRVVEDLPPDSFVGRVRAASRARRPAALSHLTPAEATAPAPGPPADLPAELSGHSKFRVVRELGRGGMGVVYQAEHTIMERPVAIKVINPAL